MAQKKSFKAELNPALQFISTPAQAPEERRTEEAPEGYKVNPLYVEKKTKRLQLLVQPSLYEKVKSRADAEGFSVNDYIHRLLDTATKGE